MEKAFIKNDESSLSLSSIKLHEAENAWKPSFKNSITIDKEERLKKFIQGVMNKLTFQKFKILLAQIKELDMDTENKLSLFVDLIFENAVYDPCYSILYANLCKHLDRVQIQEEGKPEKEINILSLIINKCQHELHRDYFYNPQKNSGLSLPEKCVSENTKNLQHSNDHQKLKIRYFGALRFFGELYNLNPFMEEMLHHHLELYLQHRSEESLEYLCILIKTIGKVFELHEDSNKSKFEEYFAEIQNILEECPLSSRIKFMIMDLIDLKENNWIPRRKESVPETIDQIRNEAKLKQEELDKKYNYYYSKKKTRSKKNKNMPGNSSCDDGTSIHKNEDSNQK